MDITIFRTAVYTARKDYDCLTSLDCGGIKAGETYTYVVGLMEGDFFTHRECLACSKADF